MKLFWPLFFVLTVLLYTSCKDSESEFIIDKSAKVEVLMSAEDFTIGTTRTSLTVSNDGTKFSWKEGDVVAVYSDGKGMTNFFINHETLSSDGKSAMFNGSGFRLSNNSTYYAFYPYNGEESYLDKTQIPISYEGQMIAYNGDCSNLGGKDYMYASGETDEDGGIGFTFAHVGCVVSLDIIAPCSSCYTRLNLSLDKDGSNKSLITSGTLNLTLSDTSSKIITTTTTGEEKSTLTIDLNSKYGGISVDKDSVLAVHVMMAPQDLSVSRILVSLIGEDNRKYEGFVSGLSMNAGYTYRYLVNSLTYEGFFGEGQDMPNEKYAPSLVSTYSDNETKSYEALVVDNKTLYASGLFGLKVIDYSNEESPTLIRTLSSQSMTGRNDMRARGIAMKDDVLYLPFRQSSSGETEKFSAKYKFLFEKDYDYSNKFTVLSTSQTINNFFKAIKVSSANINQKVTCAYLYKGKYQDGYYLNTIMLKFEDGSYSRFFRTTYNTLAEALADLQESYTTAQGDFCTVDWDAIKTGGVVIENFNFNLAGEYSYVEQSGNSSIEKSSVHNPSSGNNSLRFSTKGSESNIAELFFNLPNLLNSGSTAFWLRADEIGTAPINIPVLANNSINQLSLILSKYENQFSIGLNMANNETIGSKQLKKAEWYNIKINYTSNKATLYYRTKEAGNWKEITSVTTVNSIQVNQLATGVLTSGNSEIYIDDFYYNSSEIDNVQYINGKIAIVNKNSLEVLNVLNLDTKAIDANISDNTMVVTTFYGFNVYDITNSENPILASTYRVDKFKEFQNCNIFEVYNKKYVIIANFNQGFTIADITDPYNVKVVVENDYSNAYYNGECLKGLIYSFDVTINYPYAYLTSSTNRNYLNTEKDRRGIMTIDLRNFNSLNPQFSFVNKDLVTDVTKGDPNPTHIARIGKYLLINNTDKGFLVFEIGAEGIPKYKDSILPSNKCSVNCFYSSKSGSIYVGDNTTGSSSPSIYYYNGF